MKRKINKISMAIVAIVMFCAALLLSAEQDGQGKWKFATVSAFADGENGGGEDGGGDDCPWYVPSSSCNKRTESIPVTCVASYGATITYFSEAGKIVGSGMVNGAVISMSWGIQTVQYIMSGGTTESYPATKVNCPTDGTNYDCETYFPC